MTAQPAALPVPAAEPAERAEPMSERATLALTGLYYLLAAVIVTWWLWRDPASRLVSGNYDDTDQMAWFFRYDAAAIAHFHLPALVTTGMNAPQGVNLMWNTPMLLLGCVLAPVTLLAGAQTSLTVVTTLGFAGSALAMCAVLRHWRVSRPAATLAGLVYGFSPALLQSAIGHYDLQFAVFLPLLVDAALRLLAGRLTPVRGGLWLGLLITAQLFVNEEMLFDAAVTGLLLACVLCPAGWRETRTRVVPAVKGFAVAFGVTLLIAGYPLWLQFLGPLPQSGSPFTLDFFKNDLSGLVVPSARMLFHTSTSAAFATNYQGGPAEYLGYLGVPLVVVLVAGAVRFWRRPAVQACAVAWLVTELLSLGGTLLAAGHEYSHAKLPWYWVQGLPLLSSAIPDRFSIVADGAAAALLAFVVDAAVPVVRDRLPGVLSTGRKPLIAVMSCAVLAVLPLVPRPLSPADTSPLPSGWTAAFTALHLPAEANVLVVPIPSATFTAALRWQAESGEPAAMVGGYYMGPAWNGHVYIDGDGTPPEGQYLNALWSYSVASIPARLSAQLPVGDSISAAPVAGVTNAQMYTQIVAWHLSAVVAVTVPSSPLGKYLSVILGRPAVVTGDVMAWHVL